MMEAAFIERNSLLHKADARTKMVCLLISIVIVFLPIQLTGIIIFAFIVILLSLLSLGIKEGLKPLKLILPVLIMMVLLSPFYGHEGQLLLSIGNKKILYESGVLRVIKLASRFTTLTLVFSLLIRTTTRNDMLSGFRSFGMPFQAALTVSLILRFIPTTAKTMSLINDSHMIRQTGGKKRKKLKEFIPLLISAIVFSLRTINPLGRTLSQRGLQLTVKRSRLHVLGSWKKPIIEIIFFCFPAVLYCMLFWR